MNGVLLISSPNRTAVLIGGGSSAMSAAALLSHYQILSFTGDGVTTSFAQTQTPVFVLSVLYNGQEIYPGSGAGKYTVSGANVIFGTAPENGVGIVIKSFY